MCIQEYRIKTLTLGENTAKMFPKQKHKMYFYIQNID